MRMFKNLLYFLLLSSIMIQPVTAQEEDPLLEKGISFYKNEDYDEAIDVLKKVRDEDPGLTLAAYYLGLSYKQIEDYGRAESHLRDAVIYEPKIKGALMELIEVQYQIGKFEEAHKNIAIAEKEGIRPAQTSFLKGVVLSKEGRNLEAVDAFETAKSQDPSLKQTADYQIGLAYMKEKKFNDAREIFKEVVDISATSNIAQYASRYIEAISRKKEAEKPFRFTFGASYQYDDNVILKPGDLALTSDIANASDTREVVTFSGEYKKAVTDKLKLSARYSLYWSHQDDLSNYDVFSNSFSLTPAYYMKTASLSVPLGYSHTMVSDSGYLSALSVNPLFNMMLGDSVMAQLFCGYENKYFLQDPSSDAEDRDSNNYSTGAGLFWFFAENKGFLNLRYSFNIEDAKGNNWENVGNKFSSTVLVPVTDKFNVSVSGEAYLQDFLNTHTVYGAKREDDVYSGTCMLSYDLLKDVELQLKYAYIKDDSNIAVYDYDRNIISAGAECKF